MFTASGASAFDETFYNRYALKLQEKKAKKKRLF